MLAAGGGRLWEVGGRRLREASGGASHGREVGRDGAGYRGSRAGQGSMAMERPAREPSILRADQVQGSGAQPIFLLQLIAAIYSLRFKI
jgi:hypothetical protein